ncbi:MAG: flagellin FliC [Gammaproteobacteria bacterium]|jgi:flagellin|nr:flagellin FliC [Gammaproteobacteria bacterium]MCF6261227.1 flagellin FliC [Gammaproteobacteria bacterium]MCF6338432.1 flagellin FliC [Gammaproteobacteria bacterium]NOY73970.1 flagellin FliC [Gammaproteobacteria bacterium]
MAASIINTNIMSLNAQKNLNKNSLSLATSIERLSSGLRVNSARDDAAGLAVGISLESTVRGLSVQIRNAADNISTAQTLDGEAAVITDVLQRMNELSVQAQGTNGLAQVSKIQVEFDALNTFQAAFAAGTSIAGTLGSGTASNIGTALGALAGTRAGYGATIATSEFTIQNFETARENNAAARSRIMDADFAMETANLARGQILVQAGTAMVAQANSIPQNVLSLLR